MAHDDHHDDHVVTTLLSNQQTQQAIETLLAQHNGCAIAAALSYTRSLRGSTSLLDSEVTVLSSSGCPNGRQGVLTPWDHPISNVNIWWKFPGLNLMDYMNICACMHCLRLHTAVSHTRSVSNADHRP
jgi:hypothetical protein